MNNKNLIAGVIIANCILATVAIIGYAMDAIEMTTFFLLLAVTALNLLMIYNYKRKNERREN